MLDERERFEQQIRADPDEIAHWKVYADYLLAHGDWRGELIMLECAAETAPSPELEAAIAPLRARLEGMWMEDLADDEWEHLPRVHYDYRRGVIWSALLAELHDTTMTLLHRLLDGEHLRLLTEIKLHLEEPFDDHVLYDLIEHASFTRLLSLRCIYDARGSVVARALARHDALMLRHLDLRYASLADGDVAALAACEALRGLRTLHVQRNMIGPDGMQALAAAPLLDELELLDLRYNRIGPVGAAHLAASPRVGKLRSLLLHASDVGPEGVEALASSRTLAPDIVRLWRGQRGARA